jgi:tetratricopeptide (TPR) repeat protein
MEDIMAYKARLDKDPKDLEALVSLANANMMISRFDQAQELYVRALAINPNDLNLRTNLAIAYKYGGKPDQAFAELNKNLKMDPNHDTTLYNLGFLYLFDKQDPKNAVATWKKWLALYPNSPAAGDLRTQVAQVEAEMGKGAVSSK